MGISQYFFWFVDLQIKSPSNQTFVSVKYVFIAFNLAQGGES